MVPHLASFEIYLFFYNRLREFCQDKKVTYQKSHLDSAVAGRGLFRPCIFQYFNNAGKVLALGMSQRSASVFIR